METGQKYVLIPEEQIRMALTITGENENYQSILEWVDAYKEAEMHPMIIMDRDYRIYVVAEETFGKKLH
jgi:hypothetical protein